MKPSFLTPFPSRVTGELLHLIFTFLIDSPKDMYSCSLVNVEWSRFATPLLWRRPIFYSKSSLISFMNVLAVNNKVAQYVRELDLERYKGNLLSIHLIERLIKFLPSLESLSILSFDNHLHRRSSNLFLTSLFLTCPNLKRLTLTVTICDRDLLTDTAFLMRNCSQLEELKFLMNFNPASHLCQKPVFDAETLFKFQNIQPLNQLKCLEIAGPFVDDFLLKVFLPRTPNLTKLTVVGGVFSSQYILRISTFCPKIHSMNLIRFEDIFKRFGQVCTEIGHYFSGRLTELSVSLTNVGEMSPILWKSLNKSVTLISLHNIRITNVFIKALADFIGPDLHTLRLQNIYHSQRPGIRAWTAILSKCGAGLSILDISMNSQMNDRIGRLVAQYCHSLSSLSIAKTKLTNDSIVPIVRSNRNQLKCLNLNGLNLDEPIFWAISACKRIQTLHLQTFGPLVDNTDLIPLLKMIGGQLHYLDLRGRVMNARMCKVIAKYCSHLRGLSFCNHSKLYDEVVLSLLLLRPNLQITDLHCSKCFFVKGGLSNELIERIREHGMFSDISWYQGSERDCLSLYHKLAGMLD